MTISTVGYGDRFPVTDLGRIGGAIIIVIGVGIFGTFTGYLANLFLGSKEESVPSEADAAATPAPLVSSADARVVDAAVTRPSDAELRALAEAAEANLVAIRNLLDSKPSD